LDGQFVETRIDKGFPACQWGFFHKDIHSDCGYPKKRLTIRYLALSFDTEQETSDVLARRRQNLLVFDYCICKQLFWRGLPLGGRLIGAASMLA
jgi:hypothetical protein